ncbi:MAG TPA: A24 family peptidase [Xanthobacteraceae bacterium]|nr:A24 family peptidase [Xanthobacteraceae bacterium]
MTRRDLCAFAAIGAVALAAAATSLAVAPGLRGVLGAGLALAMVAIAAIDARHFIIPDVLSGAAFALALANAAIDPWGTVLEGLGAALLRGAVLAASFFALRAVYYRIRGREGIGLGDVKLAGVAGAWLDWTTIPIAIEIAALAALAVYLLRQFAGRRPVSAMARLPFGLFLAPAIWLGWLLDATLLAS